MKTASIFGLGLLAGFLLCLVLSNRYQVTHFSAQGKEWLLRTDRLTGQVLYSSVGQFWPDKWEAIDRK